MLTKAELDDLAERVSVGRSFFVKRELMETLIAMARTAVKREPATPFEEEYKARVCEMSASVIEEAYIAGADLAMISRYAQRCGWTCGARGWKFGDTSGKTLVVGIVREARQLKGVSRGSRLYIVRPSVGISDFAVSTKLYELETEARMREMDIRVIAE